MNEINPWILPDNKGTVHNTYRMDPLFKQALQELVESESSLVGRKVSMMTITFNLSTRDTQYMRSKRRQLAKRYKELKNHRKHFDIKKEN